MIASQAVWSHHFKRESHICSHACHKKEDTLFIKLLNVQKCLVKEIFHIPILVRWNMLCHGNKHPWIHQFYKTTEVLCYCSNIAEQQQTRPPQVLQAPRLLGTSTPECNLKNEEVHQAPTTQCYHARVTCRCNSLAKALALVTKCNSPVSPKETSVPYFW